MGHTWNSSEELDCISVAMETELCMGHGAERDKRARCHFITVFITIDTDHAAWPVGRSVGDCLCFVGGKKKLIKMLCLFNCVKFSILLTCQKEQLHFNYSSQLMSL